MSPEHVHVVVVHLPIVGLLAALIPLAWAVVRRDRTSAALGLAIAAAFALATPIAAASGEGAEERLEHASGGQALDAASEAWLETHEERAEGVAVVLYVATAALLAGLVVLLRRGEDPAWTRAIAAGGLATSVVGVALLAWVANAGGMVRHVELRPAPDTADTAAAAVTRGQDHDAHDD